MASTNKTTNYELSQFVETDRPAWLTDYNGDMRTIDSTMKAISDVASGASGSISELADRMSTAEGNITTNTNDIAALDARADALEAGAQSQAGTIANIQTEQTAQNLGIEAATELGYNLARPYDSASTYSVGDYVLFQNTLYKCITAVATGEAFDPTKWLAIKATDEIAAGGYTLPIASASLLGGVKVGNNLSIDPATGILSASGAQFETFDFNSSQAGIQVLERGAAASNYIFSYNASTNEPTIIENNFNYTFNSSRIRGYRIGNYIALVLNASIALTAHTLTINDYLRLALQFKLNTNYSGAYDLLSKVFGWSNATNYIQWGGIYFQIENGQFDGSNNIITMDSLMPIRTNTTGTLLNVGTTYFGEITQS